MVVLNKIYTKTGDDGSTALYDNVRVAKSDARVDAYVPKTYVESEAMRILHQVQEGVERPKASVSFEIGENVRVADGPFASFSGVVEEIDEARSRVKVAVSIFGRATPVELEFGQVEKL